MRNSITLTVMLLALTACSAPVKTQRPPSLPPMIQCGEHDVLEKLPIYPTAPNVDSLSEEAQLIETNRYSAAQSKWAIEAAGVYQRNAAKYHGVGKCLDDARKSNFIR